MKTYAIDHNGNKISVDIIEPGKDLTSEVIRIERKEKQKKLFKARLPRLIISTVLTTIWQLGTALSRPFFIAGLIIIFCKLFGIEIESQFIKNACLLSLLFVSSHYINIMVDNPMCKIGYKEARTFRRVVGGLLWTTGISVMVSNAAIYFIDIEFYRIFAFVMAFEIVNHYKTIFQEKTQKA